MPVSPRLTGEGHGRIKCRKQTAFAALQERSTRMMGAGGQCRYSIRMISPLTCFLCLQQFKFLMSGMMTLAIMHGLLPI